MTILSGVKLKLYPNKAQNKSLNKPLEAIVLFGINFAVCKKTVMKQ